MKTSKVFRLARALTKGGILAAIGTLLYWQRAEIIAHPRTSLLIGLGSATLLALMAFGKKVWAKLEGKWVDSVAGWIDAQTRLYLGLFFSGFGLSTFRSRYYQQLVYRHRFFNVRGLRTRGEFTPELDKVFVELAVAPRSVESVSPDLLRSEGLSGKRSAFELLVSDQPAFRALAVIGAPGSGKTTLLQHLALVFARNQQRRHEERCSAFVPILLFLRNHAETMAADNHPDLAELATRLESQEGLKPPPGWFERQLRRGKALVLLDGLDEVARTDRRRAVVDWVAKQIERFGASRFIVTSRPHGYKTTPLPAAAVLEVQPFSLEQVERFVRGWYLANEVLSVGKNDPGVRQQAERQAQDLMRRLRNAPTLAALAVNPLLLTMIALVHRYRGALPGRRVELYAEICDVLLGHWQASKGLNSELTPAQQRAVLQPLAFQLMTERTREVAAAEAASIIRESLTGVQGTTADPARFLKDVEKGSGLLLEGEAGIYSFGHLTFQEYLAASHLLEQHNVSELLKNVGDPWWHETLRLYAAQTDATPVVRACLESDKPNVASLTLAYECVSEARSVDAEVREALEEQLIEGLEASDPEHRKLAAEVMLEIRLRNLLRLSETVEIDTSYISCAEYQLFIDECRSAADYRQPDHWANFHFSEGMAQQPIAGVRASDATAFCRWLTQRSMDTSVANLSFRLTTSEEASQYPIRVSSTGDRFDSLRVASVGSWSATNDPPEVAGLSLEVKEAMQQCLEDTRIRALDLARTRANALDLARNRTLIIARSRSNALAHTRAVDLVRDRNLTSRGVPDLSCGLDLDRVLNRTDITGRIIDHDLRLALTLARDRTLARAMDRDQNLNLKGAFERDLVLALDHALTVALDSDLDLYLEDDLVLFCSMSLFLERTRGRFPACEGIRLVRERITNE